MIELPAGIWNITPYGALVGMIVLAYFYFASGRVIPRASHERELAAANKRGDEWKETALDQREVNAEIRAQNTMLLEASRAASHFFQQVSPTVDETTQPGGTYVAPK